jgi:glycerophosphoryl diester phosphodiesterase
MQPVRRPIIHWAPTRARSGIGAVTANAAAIELVAHRGDALDFPENTLPAFESAVQRGLRWLECDVQLAADGTPFVVHDADLRRVAGIELSVLDSATPLLDTVEPIERERFGARFAGTKLPRLETLAAWLAARPGVQLFVELKRASLAAHGRRRCLDATLAALASVGERCVIISFDHDVLPLARAAGLRIGWVLPQYQDATLDPLRRLCPEFAFCDRLKLPPDGALDPGARDWAVYEVRDAATARALRARGVGFIETMAVAALARELDLARPGI